MAGLIYATFAKVGFLPKFILNGKSKLNELGADSFGETGKNSYSIQRSGDALTVENLRGDRQIILQVKGQEIEFANLSEFDIQQFEQARQLQKELKKEHWRDK